MAQSLVHSEKWVFLFHRVKEGQKFNSGEASSNLRGSISRVKGEDKCLALNRTPGNCRPGEC
jgi:hypothetical protein